MIHLTATFHAAAGKEQELKSELEKMLIPTRNEEGNLRYQLFQAKEQTGTFLFQEHFLDQAAFDTHCQTPHFLNLLDTLETKSLLSCEPAIVFFNEING